jgi:ABC-type oligopeptide transport system substrate-binding subunit
MKKVVTLLATLVLAATLSFAPAASAHEGDEANETNEARSEHFLGVNWDAPWMSRALVSAASR